MESKVIQITGDGTGYMYALCEDGSVWYWGQNVETEENQWICAHEHREVGESQDMFPQTRIV